MTSHCHATEKNQEIAPLQKKLSEQAEKEALLLEQHLVALGTAVIALSFLYQTWRGSYQLYVSKVKKWPLSPISTKWFSLNIIILFLATYYFKYAKKGQLISLIIPSTKDTISQS